MSRINTSLRLEIDSISKNNEMATDLERVPRYGRFRPRSLHVQSTDASCPKLKKTRETKGEQQC